MLSEARYRQVLDEVFVGTGPNWAQGGADWNNQMILALAIHGLILLPRYGSWGGTPPFKHYVEMTAPSLEYIRDESGNTRLQKPAWDTSWIADADWEEHYKPPLKFQFTPLTRT
jgi:hypothetical protein